MRPATSGALSVAEAVACSWVIEGLDSGFAIVLEVVDR
jgi:hypothetical protein